MLSLFSLLHATALAHLQDCEEEFEVIEGIDQTEPLQRLNSDHVKDQVHDIHVRELNPPVLKPNPFLSDII